LFAVQLSDGEEEKMNSLSTDVGKLLDTIVAAAGERACESLREPMAELRQRLAQIERRLAILENVERSGREDDPLARSAQKICEQCDRKAVARGLCSAHYQQWRYRQKKAKVRGILGGRTVLVDLPDVAKGAMLEDVEVPRELNS
jgi:hypothetical protein